MKVIYAKRNGEPALYQLATATTLGEAFRIASPFRKSSPDGWKAGIGSLGGVPLAVTEPTAEVAALIAQWQADAEAGTVKASILAIQAEEAKRHANRAALVASGRYKWSDFDITDEDDDEDADEE